MLALNVAVVCVQGMIATLKDGYGFIQCADREARMFFHFSEFMDPEYIPEEKAEVQFTVMPVSVGFVWDGNLWAVVGIPAF